MSRNRTHFFSSNEMSELKPYYHLYASVNKYKYRIWFAHKAHIRLKQHNNSTPKQINKNHNSGDGNDMNPALPDTSMKLGRYVYKHELFEMFSLANQNYSNFQDGGSKFQDGYQNKY